jgi:NADP-dependent 3-hydroxy acid dehydrogenase YdfG
MQPSTGDRATLSTAVVTGAASGIGAALARELRGRVERLVLADVDTDGLDTITAELDAIAVATDVSDASAMERLAEVAGPPSLLCLNAGVVSASTGPPWDAPPAEWERVLGVNLGGVVNGLRAFVPGMLESGATASILITGSLAGVLTWPGGGPYAASKHAVRAVAEQTALALAGSPISVTLLCPALVRTGMSEIGEPAVEVARRGLAAADAGEFVVAPDEWSTAIVRRAERSITGAYPTVPDATEPPMSARVRANRPPPGKRTRRP